MRRALILAVGIGVVIGWMAVSAAPPPVEVEAEAEIDPVRPATPPDPEHYVAPRALPHPEPPSDAAEIRADALARAIAKNAERPGETAFRATVNAFVHHNQKFAEAQAKREGLTREEVEELTYFGLMVQETQRWEDVEAMIGRDLAQEERTAAEELMHSLNAEFKARMREMVARGASAEERWQYIRETQAQYRSRYFALTGMNELLLDDLLAGDASRAYSHALVPPPEDEAPSEEDPEAPVQRPASPPEETPEETPPVK